MEDNNQEIKEEIKVNNENRTEKLVQIIAGLITFFIILTLVIIKLQKPEFALKWVFIIGGIVLIFGILAFFSFKIYHKVSDEKEIKEEKLPKIATEEQLKLRCMEILSSIHHQNHIKKWGNIKHQIINGNSIYDFEIFPLYNRELGQEDIIHIIINAHFIDRLPNILYYEKNKVNNAEIKHAINMSSTNPFPDADIRRKRIYNPITGTTVETSEKTYKEKEKKKEKFKKEDLE